MRHYRTQTVGEITYVLDDHAETYESGFCVAERRVGAQIELSNRWGTLRIQFPSPDDTLPAERDELRKIFLAAETLLADRLP